MTDFLKRGGGERQGSCDARQRPSLREGREVWERNPKSASQFKGGETEAQGGQAACPILPWSPDWNWCL